MIDYQRFYFAAPSYTGGEWFARAMSCVGVDRTVHNNLYQPFDGCLGLKVSLVAHPFDMLYMYFLDSHGCNREAPMDFDLGTSPRFGDFLRTYLTYHPGQLSTAVCQYKSDVVLRLEDMPWALEELLRDLGIAGVNGVKQAPLPVINAPDDNGLRHKIVMSERDLCERYNYY